ncbi:MAG TPA: hypothetical protein VE966_08850 [Gemmatimonadales bacterium]|nr:hypothetical protein [Gemmatimonadales bacterium]
MRHVLASACMALLVATRAAAAQDLTIDWSRTVVPGGVVRAGEGPGGTPVLELRAAASGPTSLHLVTIDHPPVSGPRYVVAGQVRYQGVEGQGYLEMWTVFPNGERFFTRTLAAQGSLGALHGESNWRRFELPFDMSGASQVPSRLEINLVLSGPGTVWLGPIHLQPWAGQAGTNGGWWSERVGTLVGTMLGSFLGVVGAMIGVLSGRGRARRLVLTLLVGMIAVGGGLALVGAGAALSSQPRHVWYPLLAIGGAAAVIGLVILPALRRRFAAEELRRIDALDAGSRS